jgi:hypothetical protein
MARRKNFPNRRKARREGAYKRRVAFSIALYGAKTWPLVVQAELRALAPHVSPELHFKGLGYGR